MGKKIKSHKEEEKKGKNQNKDLSKKKKQKLDKTKEENKSKENIKEENEVVEKKVAISFDDLKQTFNNDDINNLSLNDLKKIASNFDVNPYVNYKLLSLLKQGDISEYNKYIDKYKYTLDYNHAKILGCLPNNGEDIIEEYNKNNKENIKEIKILSKYKLFNFLYYIINLKRKTKLFEVSDYQNSLDEIKEKIMSYSSHVDLIFKIPNNYGNFELQYYTYLELFIDYFSKKLDPKNDDNNDSSFDLDNDAIKQRYFDWDDKCVGKKETINIKEFEDKKKELRKFIEESVAKLENESGNIIQMETEKGKEEDNKIDKDINLIYKNTPKNIYISFFDSHQTKLKKYKDEINYLFKNENDDNKFLKCVEFIYYYLLFTKEKNFNIYDSYPYCLNYTPSTKNESHTTKLNDYTWKNSETQINKEELVFYNLDQFFWEEKDNPFANKAKYYQYPYLLKKNIFQENQEISDHFKNLLRDIYSSKLLEEIYYLTPEFKDFKYPLSDKKILEEMIENTTFLPFGNEKLHGYTQKQFAKIYISSNFPEFNKDEISKIIINISLKLNTMIHEQFKHYIKALLHYNSFRFRKAIRLDSDLSGYQEEKFYIDNIQKIYSKKKNTTVVKSIVDRGSRAEIYLYGSILDKLYLEEAINMFDLSTWKLSVKEHLEKFNKNNIPKIMDKTYYLNEIKDNDTMNDFLKDIFIQYIIFYKLKSINLYYNEALLDSRKSDENNNYMNNDEFFLDYSICLQNTKVNVPDTETDKKLLYLFED